MIVEVNGESRKLPEGCSVAALLETLGLAKAACAVEVNRDLIPKTEHAKRTLEPGDRVEVVALVGGG